MKILIVDDKKENLYLLERMIKKIGYEAVMAENGKQALEKLHSDNFKMIISDILMPVMDGYQLCKAVRSNKEFNDLLFIFYTATYLEKEDEEFGVELGADKFVRKPMEPEKFIEIIKNLIQTKEIRPIKSSKTIIKEEKELFKLYSERLVNKLERKMLALEKETTNRKNAEEKLKEQNKFLTNLIESLTNPFYVIDTNDYTIKMANTATNFNFSSGVSTCYAFALKRGEPCKGIQACPMDEMKKTKKPVTIEHIYYNQDNNIKYVQVHGFPIFDEEGNVIQMIEYFLDITERKKAEQKLKESEKKYREILENIKDLYFEVDLKGNFVFFNDMLGEILGYSKSEVSGMNYRQIMNKESAKKIFKVFNTVFKTNNIVRSFEFEIKNKYGKRIFLDSNIYLKYDSTGKKIGFRGLARDITERKKSEKIILNLAKFPSENPSPVLRINKTRVLYINNAGQILFNIKEGSSIPDSLSNKAIEAFEYNTTKDVELELNHRDYSFLITPIKNKKYANIYGMDITERKKREEEIRLQSEIIENMSEGVYLIKLDDGTIVYTNPAFEEMFGYNPGEMIGKDVAIVNTPTDKTPEETKDEIIGILKETGEWHGEVLNIKKDGTSFWCYANVSLFDHPEYGIVIVSVHTDITERKKAEALRERFAEKLENKVKKRTKELNESLDQQKLYQEQLLKASQFKSKFLASMSHELRTPLNSVIGFTDIILEGFYGEINEKQDRYLNNIRSSAFHLLDLINKVLDISKIEGGKIELNIEEFPLNKIVDQIITTLKPMYEEKKLKFELIGLDEEKFIQADPIRFKEILYNLLNNAIKFTKEGGFKLEIAEHEDHLMFNIIDTGIGIAEEDFDLIFKEFTRVKSDYVYSVEGTGLGLSLTKRFIELHGGNISFTSKLGEGTTFTFILPKKMKK